MSVVRILSVTLAAAAASALAAPRQPERPKLPSARPPPLVRYQEFSRITALRELTDYSLAGMSRRFGPDYAFYHRTPGNEKPFPEIWMAPTKQDPGGRRYQIGGPWSRDAGDYSSTQGQVLYVPDQAGGVGVDRVMILEMAHNTYSERPEPPWHGGFRPEPESRVWLEAAGQELGIPIGIARGMGVWANCGVIVFSSGWIGTAGTATAQGRHPTLRLPAGKIPTAISVTPKNEFALITVVDTQRQAGQLAVIALTAGGTGFAHEWKDPQPALCSVALVTGMKLLGFVDLPGITVPTSVCGVGDTVNPRVSGPDGHAGRLNMYDLSRPADRDSFLKGNNAGYVTRSGFAVVGGKYEQKVAFVDLQPLFRRANEMYFTTDENYRRTRDQGPDPKQWPFTFDADPTWRPVVVKVVPHPQPVAVLASMSGGYGSRAFVASLEGQVGFYTVGGLATEDAADPKEIRYIGQVQVGRNPVCLTYQKYTRDTIIAVSRGDREIAWIRHDGSSASVIRRMRDSRLLDPIGAEMADTHGTDTAIISVTDFKGRRLLNYRFADIVFVTNGGARFGMGPDGKAEFECGGDLEIPGAPFAVSATNVN